MSTESSTAICPGSCGELIQGITRSGQAFHATAPITAFAASTARWGGGASSWLSSTGRQKTLQALRLLLDRFGASQTLLDKINIEISSDLIASKGMASSTADISSTCAAVADLLALPAGPDTLSSIALEVEPSDGLMYPGVVLYDQTGGGLLAELGPPPPMNVAVFDTGGTVDTLAFNSQEPGYSEADIDALEFSLLLLEQGFRRMDPTMIGEAATLSARANQSRLPKPGLERVISVARRAGAYGVNVAHSGTLIGMLVDADDARFAEKYCDLLPHLTHLGIFRLTSGGISCLSPLDAG